MHKAPKFHNFLIKISPKISSWWNEEYVKGVKTIKNLRKKGWRNNSNQKYNNYFKFFKKVKKDFLK